jgi:ferredoxin
VNKQTTTVIYFFSGTGNSLFVARQLAKRLDAKLVSIPAVMGQDAIEPDADAVGIVFPVYYATNDAGGIPLIVTRFINKLSALQTKYLFTVCTHGGNPGTTVENLKKALALRGGKLAGGFTVKMSNHTLSPEKQQHETTLQQEKLDTVAKYVAAKKIGKYETRGRLGKLAAAPALHLLIKPIFSKRFRGLSGIKQNVPFLELVPSADRGFQVNQSCNGCGLCTKVCPVSNIQLFEGKPVWLHHCETCFTCYTWCPQNAIGGPTAEYNERYHHPEVKLSDVLEKTKK